MHMSIVPGIHLRLISLMVSALSALAVSLTVAQPPLVQLGPRPYYLVNDMTDS